MKSLKIYLMLILMSLTGMKVQAVTEAETHKTVSMLDKEIHRRGVYIDRRQAIIDSLGLLLRRQTLRADSLPVMLEIARAYTSFNNDSAIAYYAHGYDLSADSDMRKRMRMGMGALLPLAGFNYAAIGIFQDEINPDSLPTELKIIYYDRARQMYSYVADYYASHPEYSDRIRALSDECQQRLIELLPKESAEYKLNLGELYLKQKQYARARAILADLVAAEPVNSNMRARAANMLSQIADAANDNTEKIHYLALSAISDVTSATREVKSLQSLGIELNALGDFERAYSYISVAMENAVNCHASTRMVESSVALPIIERSYLNEIASSRRNTMWVIAALAVVVILLAGAALLLLKDNRREKMLREHLRQANEVKEFYISRFLSLCSIYMDKMSSLCNIVDRKITAGNVDDLHRMVRSGKFIEEQSTEFYDVFDEAFLHICPTFVADVNALLRPDEQITLAPGERLNTDLRILAFLRLGIDDASRIARILNYSVNTVYAYRNRLKARAIDRDRFEEAVCAIGK